MSQQPLAGERQLVSFFLGAEEYGVDIALVQEIVHHTDVTRVPRAPACVEGVVNLRGRIVPVVDLRRKLGLAGVAPTSHTRIIIVAVAGRTVGLIVDGVREVLRLDQGAIDEAPALAAARSAPYVEGVGKLDGRLLILLDLERALEHDGEGAPAARHAHAEPRAAA